MCLNRKCHEVGRCDYCDARCEYYVNDNDFYKFMETRGKGIVSYLHMIAVKRIENSTGQGGAHQDESLPEP